MTADRSSVHGTFEKLVDIIKALRHPQTGCPWDLKQTHQTLIAYLLEEAHEVIEAIESNSMEELKNELGDLLLQVLLHAEIARGEGRFSIDEVIEGITAKLIRRHPHVFGDLSVRDAEEVKRNWEQIKQAEKAQKAESTGNESDKRLLEGVPRSLPALLRATRISDKARQVGFDWPTWKDLRAKLLEEIDEFHEAARSESADEKHLEFGDILFVLVNIARKNGVDPESALQATNNKFISRFDRLEQEANKRFGSIDKAHIDQLEAIWKEIKARDSKTGV